MKHPALRLYRLAVQRFEDAVLLIRGERRVGGIYLGGYAVECALKALILAQLPATAESSAMATWRGAVAHNLEWLREQYIKAGGAPFPPEVVRTFAKVTATWSVDLRYYPGQISAGDTRLFMEAVQCILLWSKGRLG